MPEEIRRLNIGCSPEAAVSGPILVQSNFSATLIFNAMKQVEGAYQAAGLAVVSFKACSITKFGYPNDEAWSAIPRTSGLSYDFYEVLNSSWNDELDQLNRHGFPRHQRTKQRHFLALFHDSSFECLAQHLSVELTHEPLANVLSRLNQGLLTE